MSQFSNLSANSRLDGPTANSGTIYVANAELFGLSTNPIEVSASGTKIQVDQQLWKGQHRRQSVEWLW